MTNLMTEKQYEAYIKKQLHALLDTIGTKLNKAGINKGSVIYLHSLARYFNKLHKRNEAMFYNERDLTKLKALVNTKISSLKTERTRDARLVSLSKIQFKSAVGRVFDGAYRWIEPAAVMMYLYDTADHIALAVALNDGDVKKADRLTDDMDTVEIPASVWNFLMKEFDV